MTSHRLMYLHIMSCVLGSAAACVNYNSREPLQGYYCAVDGQIKLTRTTRQRCVMHCMARGDCRSLSYSSSQETCLMTAAPCAVLDVHAEFQVEVWTANVQDPKDCIHWIQWSGYPNKFPARTVHGKGRMEIAVVRVQGSGGSRLPGKFENSTDNMIYTIDGQADFAQRMDHATSEILQVDSACSLAWLPYDSTEDTSLPRGAIAGGYLSDGTTLYISRKWISIPEATEYVFGYYNPATGVGNFQLWGTHTSRSMDILVSV